MKRSISFLFVIALFSSFTWNTDTDYSGLLSAEMKADYISTSSSPLLKTNLAEVFSDFFDEVERVDIHNGVDRGYYYTVYGRKAGIATAKAIMVSKKMTEYQYFPDRTQLGASDGFCYWKKIGDTDWIECQENEAITVCGQIPDAGGGDQDDCSDFNLPIPIPIPGGIIWIRPQ